MHISRRTYVYATVTALSMGLFASFSSACAVESSEEDTEVDGDALRRRRRDAGSPVATPDAGRTNDATAPVSDAGASQDAGRDVQTPPVDSGAARVRANLLFESTFDGVAISGTNDVQTGIGQDWSNFQHCTGCTHSVTSSATARSGSNSVRFELRANDGMVSGSYRTELTGPGESTTVFERWYGASFNIGNISGGDASIIQWHHNNNVSIPPMALWVSGGKFLVVHTKEGQGINNIYDDVGAAPAGVWTDFVFHIKWNNTSAGLLEVWKNGVKVLTYNGPTGYVGGNYMKTGIYQWGGVSSTQTLLVDEVRIGSASATYADVAPGN